MFVTIAPEPSYAPDVSSPAPWAPSRRRAAPAPWVPDARVAWDVLCMPLYVFLDTAFKAHDLDRVAELACAGAPRPGRDDYGRAYPDLGAFCAACDGAAALVADALNELHRSDGHAVCDLAAFAARLGTDGDAAGFVATWFGEHPGELTCFSPTCLVLWLRLRAGLLRARGLPCPAARRPRRARGGAGVV